jgi:23S rRNA pseudouridine2605 synthase
MCGITSRRGADALIAARKVVINDQTLEEKGAIVDTDIDTVKVDGVVAVPVDEKVYVVLNKPTNTMTTLNDPFKRRTVVDYLKSVKHRVYPVGRLDFDAEGVLLLTNDGDLAFRLAHPRYRVTKIYEAVVEGKFVRDKSDRIKRGIRLEDGAVGRAKVSILNFTGQDTKIRLVLTEGRKREVKQLCGGVGHPVKHLRRVEFAGVRLQHLKTGQFRSLTKGEVNRLKQLVGLI